MQAHLFVISSPSGGGKSTVIRKLMEADPTLRYSVSMTTRAPRDGEVHGKDYWFADVATFQNHIEDNAFLEWAEVHGAYYGTLRQTIQDELDQGHSVLLDLDVQGGLAVKAQMPEAVLIFILPPSMEELEARLRARNTESLESLARRLANARGEMAVAERYDHRVINNILGETLAQVQNIIDSANR